MANAAPPLLYESCITSIDKEASSVSEYYGEVLKQSSDLQTNACCTIEEIPDYMKKALNNIHDDVMMKYYGCGLVHPEGLIGASVCDLGCGAGRDCYVLSQLVGESGSVTGVDFNDDQLKV
jgi:arsenite methyltransferase